MRNSPFCTTHDEKTTYSGQQWFLRPLMWGYICNGCVEKREIKRIGDHVDQIATMNQRGRKLFSIFTGTMTRTWLICYFSPQSFFLSKPTCALRFFPLQCTVILIMNALLHDMENVKRADPKRRQYTSAGAKGSPLVSHCPALFALGGQRQTVWAVIKTVCLV